MKQSNSGGNAATKAQAPVYLFNTMEIAKMLEEAGFSRAEAEAQVEALHFALSGAVATKADLKVLEVKVDAGFKVMGGKVETMATKSDLKALENRMIRWFIGAVLAVVIAADGGLINSAMRALTAMLGL